MPWKDDDDNDAKRPQNPWGGNHPDGHRRRPGQNPPDLEDMIRQTQDHLRRMLGNGNGGGNGRGGPGRMGPPFPLSPLRLGAFIAAGLAVLWLVGGFYFIQPNENAVVLTFGQYSKTETQSGLKYAFPWPFQNVTKVDVTTERRIEIGFSSGTTRNTTQNALDESLMLTGDENIIDIDFVVMWRIADAKNYLFELRSPEDTIKMVAESAMREVMSRTKITAALTDARSNIQSDTKTLMQKILDEYQSGVTINNIQLLKVDPPSQVIDAFNDVQRARAEAERMENEAQAYRNDILPRARGEAQKTLEDAQAYKQEVMERAKGDADRFTAVYAAYAKSKDVTTQRLYIETVEQVLKSANTIVMEDSKNSASVLPYLPLNDLPRRAGPNATPTMPPQP